MMKPGVRGLYTVPQLPMDIAELTVVGVFFALPRKFVGKCIEPRTKLRDVVMSHARLPHHRVKSVPCNAAAIAPRQRRRGHDERRCSHGRLNSKTCKHRSTMAGSLYDRIRRV